MKDSNKVENEEKEALSNRRLTSIGNGDLNWIGKGFLSIITEDCDKNKPSKKQTKGLPD